MNDIDQKESAPGCSSGCGGCSRNENSPKLNVTNWLEKLGAAGKTTDLVEIQFKNTRKGYFINSNKLALKKGDLVAVESSPGHDIGTVTLTGELVFNQMSKNRIDANRYEIKRVYRHAKPTDVEKWEKAKEREHQTMIRSRQITRELGLAMKIGDVEYQGDGNKAIFYYIADERVDFRKLIRVLADEFRIRIEMKQIGARQEAGRIGGIGSCGRELCCSSWMSSFSSVSTNAARTQELSLNPQKLAGQCGKLKCCLNYEIDAYIEEQGLLPDKSLQLETEEGVYSLTKVDVFQRQLTYIKHGGVSATFVTISSDRAWDIIKLNKKNKKPETIKDQSQIDQENVTPMGYENVVGQDDLTRFDNKNKKRRTNNKRRRNPNNQQGGNNRNEQQKSSSRRSEHPKQGGPELRKKNNPNANPAGKTEETTNSAGENPQRSNDQKGDQKRGGQRRRPSNRRNGNPKANNRTQNNNRKGQSPNGQGNKSNKPKDD